MWTLFIIVIVVAIVILFIFNTPNDLTRSVNQYTPNNDLERFEDYYIKTLQMKFRQKAEKVANPTRQFTDDGNIFAGLDPWNNVPQFGTVCHTLIGYGVRFRNPSDSLYLDQDLASNLSKALYVIESHLPFPAPVNQAPWGPQADWYHFSITMPEVFQNTCIVLRGFYNLDDIVTRVLAEYLPLPTFALGWQRTAGNAMRMCLPYSYGQLLRGYTFRQIKAETQVQYVLNLINFPLVERGNGIHQDYTYFDHTDVRAYGYLINSYFTFDYYNFLFGDDTVNMYNLYNSISLIGCKQGLANPAVLSRNGAHYSNVLGYFIEYQNEIVSADFSKILTLRNDKYFGSVVGQAPEIAYYEADPTNNIHAPLWIMTRKIWPNNAAIITYRRDMLPFESGIILTNQLNGPQIIQTTGPSTSSFHPEFAHTAICNTTNAGAMSMHAKFAALKIEFYSHTLYHRLGMFHLYERIKTHDPELNNASRVIILTRDLSVQQPFDDLGNNQTSNGVVSKHHNIVNYGRNFPNFSIREVTNARMQNLEQTIAIELMRNGTGASCFSLLTQNDLSQDNTTCTFDQNTSAFIINTNSSTIQCVINFPIVIIRDNETNEITINNAMSTSTYEHTLEFNTIEEALSLLSMTISSLKVPASITKTSSHFVFRNKHSNQFKFTF
ncbi:ODV-E66 [Chrysodeixis includens nucleopolyhedrovirus]|uniref:ODV-E66 n=1 Tax=Chrysodeixis includens nucleopolyhedrovirus TaxID=1207438 RepID=A0A5B8YRB9_9ABAC|nr:ODV-E66 [Chrysodeixis includens nucleopolyhedrovirus]QED40617.1 ODV-E66 [Chrysodeixis includens nucleopolyhedrovirus]